jgi:hypothetical protein
MIRLSDGLSTSKVNINPSVDKFVLPDNKETNDVIDIVNLFTSKYHLLYAPQFTHKQFGPNVTSLQKYAISIHKNPFLYDPIAPKFVPDYMFWSDIRSYVQNVKSIGIFSNDISIGESLLYLNTELNRIIEST